MKNKISKQDFLDSLNPFNPKKYIKARFKILFVFLPLLFIALVIASVFGVISGILSFFPIK